MSGLAPLKHPQNQNYMFKFLLLPLVALTFACSLNAQETLVSRTSTTTFYSHAPLEDIEAVNNRTTAALNLEKGEIVVKMLIKHFEFENALMQEHFNENYMESETYPSALFKGTIATEKPIDINVDGDYEVEVTGTLTIHGVEQPHTGTATITVADRQVSGKTVFIARPKDFDIEIPTVVVRNIAEEIEVTTTLDFSSN